MANACHCPNCGKPLTTAALPGLCPECMLKAADPAKGGAPLVEMGSAWPAAEVAKHFPQLQILRRLGRGGMGVVYLARQPELKRLVALKVLAPEKGKDPAFLERFAREAQALGCLNHPNIVAVHDFGRVNGLCYLLMEYVDGTSLRELLTSGRLSPEEALAIALRICEALQFAHDHGVVHRDIKPENVLLDEHGRVKIADFGIAKILGAEPSQPALTAHRQVIGTPHYMAPEQVEKPQRVDHRADIYSLGVVLYEMLTGELPLGNFGPPSARMTPSPALAKLDRIILRALEKQPERRYQQAREVRTDIEAVAREGPFLPAPQPDDPHRLSDRWWWDRRLVWGYAAVPALLTIALFPPLYARWHGPAAFIFIANLVGVGFALLYSRIGRRLREMQTGAPAGDESAEGLILREGGGAPGPFGRFECPGLAILSHDLLTLLPIHGAKIVIPLNQIVSIRESRCFNGTFLWRKRGFIMRLADGSSAGVALAQPIFNRWRARLGITMNIRPPVPPSRARIWGLAGAAAVIPIAIGAAIILSNARPEEMSRRARPRDEAGSFIPARVPPVVVQTVPQSGANDVDPTLRELHVTFSQPMTDGSWSWCQNEPETFPETNGEPRFIDERTCAFPVVLRPGRDYAVWINARPFDNFKNRQGIASVPYLLVFKTKP